MSRPQQVSIREVGPRDGFQNEPDLIPTDDKVRLIEALAGAGYQRMEVASFVRPDVMPQLADGVEVLRRIRVPDHIRLSVLIPNERGLENAMAERELFDDIGLVVSASDTHNRRNINRSVEESMGASARIIPRALAEGLHCEAIIATAFGCPYEGKVEVEKVLNLATRFVEMGATEIGFGDTTGMANPWQVEEFFARAFERLPGVELTAHFHNTRGQGLANALAALNQGCASFESSFGELGGCPVPPGSTGNIATEDLLSMFSQMGIETRVDLGAVIEAARLAQDLLGRKLGSHTLVAGPIDWEPH
ncbi:MAG TPA: hydroxymethylglutaryl-CoA lyase [Acidimicrobiia bacterium]|nr:hydroxymethylglutaryl-CoA lyase [Acidimicrobiia bacterium]